MAFILYFYLKAMLTAGTHHGVFSFLLREAKIVFAVGTLLVNVSFSISFLAFLKIDKLLELTKYLEEFLVFALPFVNIS